MGLVIVMVYGCGIRLCLLDEPRIYQGWMVLNWELWLLLQRLTVIGVLMRLFSIERLLVLMNLNDLIGLILPIPIVTIFVSHDDCSGIRLLIFK